jgi:hypothetical protein
MIKINKLNINIIKNYLVSGLCPEFGVLYRINARNPVILSVICHHQNLADSAYENDN